MSCSFDTHKTLLIPCTNIINMEQNDWKSWKEYTKKEYVSFDQAKQLAKKLNFTDNYKKAFLENFKKLTDDQNGGNSKNT